jgi:hypothetical protein
MSDNRISSYDFNDQILKKDLEVILEVNKKAIEIETNVADQNEEIISLLNESKESQKKLDDNINKVIKQNEDASKEMFKLQVLFVTGLLSLIVQVIQIFIKK